MKKKFTPIMVLHLVLMILLTLATVVSLIVILAGNDGSNVQDYYNGSNVGVVIVAVLNLAALVCGIIYVVRGYTKQAAGFYKAFIALMALFNAFTIYTSYLNNGVNPGFILLIVKVILLLILAFGKNLGKKTTWILYGVMMAVYVAFLIVNHNFEGIVAYRLVVILSKLVMDGTIGLAIRGKYADKDARGAK